VSSAALAAWTGWIRRRWGGLAAGDLLLAAENIDATSYVPPVLTKSWYHTGVHLSRNRVSEFFAGLLDKGDLGEYWREPGETDIEARAALLSDTIGPTG
jgi:hypothetical protein